MTGLRDDPALKIPAEAIAVTGNLTVTGQTAAGYLALTPVATTNARRPRPSTSRSATTGPTGHGPARAPGGKLGVTYVAAGGRHGPRRSST